MNKNKLIFAGLIIIIALMMVGASSAFSLFGKQQTKLNITSSDTIYQGDEFKINLTNDKGEAIGNATINILITNDDGLNETKNITTNESGIANLTVDKDAGKYVFNCTYAGDDDFEPSNATQNLTVIYEEVSSDDSDSNYDPGAFYSAQEGRVIYTGEVHDGPDGNRYRHLGNNEWQMV